MTVEHQRVERQELAPGYSIARILNGGWQLSAGHHPNAPETSETLRSLARLAEAGFTTFDCADIYTGVEELIGRFLREWPQRDEIQVHTKLVPDRSTLPTLKRASVEAIVDRSLQRLGIERLDLVQFHWWDYDTAGCAETAGWLDDMRRAGKIRLIGATNFSTVQLGEILDSGVSIAVHQVQYSLLDRRPANDETRSMVDLCQQHGVGLLCYGSLAGGFLSERYRRTESPTELRNRSLVKYRLIIDEFGGWGLFQELLEALATVADRHGVTLSNVAVRWVLDQAQVAGAIVGARTASHLESNLRVFNLTLDDDDNAVLDAVLAKSTGPTGEVFGLERVPRGRHRVIMKTELNRLPKPQE